MAIFNGDKDGARQELCDKLNASISTQIPFIQKRVNLGRDQITKGARTQGVMHFYVPAGGNAQVGQVSGGTKQQTKDALDLTGRPRNSSFYRVECFAQNASDILEYSSFEELFQIKNIDGDIVKPRGQHMAHIIEKDIVDRNWFKAGGAIVSDAADFAALSKASAVLQSIKASGEFTGYISPMLQSYLATSPLRMQFQVPDEILRKMYGKSSIGYYANMDWVNEPFMPMFTHESTWVNVTLAKALDGANDSDTNKISLAGLKSGETIKAGTPFKITGIHDVTLAGVKQLALDYKTFVVQKDVKVSSTTAQEVEVLPMYFNGSDGWQNNLWVDPATDGSVKVAVGAKVNCPLENGATYYIGLVRDNDAFNWTPFEWSKLTALENYTTSTDELTLQIAAGGEILDRSNVMRMDCPYFGDIVDPRAVRTLFIKSM